MWNFAAPEEGTPAVALVAALAASGAAPGAAFGADAPPRVEPAFGPWAALGTVHSVAGDAVTVDLRTPGGVSALVDLPAVHHAPYAVGDRVLVLLQSADPASGVVAGRIDLPADAFVADDYLRRDGATPLAAAWDAGASVHIAVAELRARDAAGLLLADASGAAGLRVAAGGRLGAGVTAPQGVLHLWDGTGGQLFATRAAIDASAQIVIAAGAGSVTQYVRIETLVSNGSARNYLNFALQVGGVTVQTIATGGDSWQFRLNVDGSVDLRRAAGSNLGVAVVRALWI